MARLGTGNAPDRHSHRGGPLGWLVAVLHLDGHEHAEPEFSNDPAMATREGIRTVWIALAALAFTTVLQIIIFVMSGSVALLADTVHNLGDALNSVPLLCAFYLARKAATRRYTYGYGRAEDIAGVIIVISILFSAGYILWESFSKLLDPQPVENLPWVTAAAIIGFLGNEAVAMFQIRSGKRIGSESLVVDGMHARIDGLTSLVVLVAVAGSVLGYPILDPIIGLLIGVAIVFIARDATKRVWYRLMDAVDPIFVDQIEQYAGDVPNVDKVLTVRARWVGHQLYSEIRIAIADRSMSERDRVVDEVRRSLLAYVRHLSVVSVDVVPSEEACGTADAASTPVQGDSILPPRYQDSTTEVSAAPMGAAALQYDNEGAVAWDEMWTGYCELALAGGAPHRGTLLEPVDEAEIAENPEKYEEVIQELERAIELVTGLPAVRGATPGWIGLKCTSEEMALWLLRAIVVENVTVRREDNILWFPAGPSFRLEREIKNVVTVIAKTNHYWEEHVAGGSSRRS